jgi:hypothetical protein
MRWETGLGYSSAPANLWGGRSGVVWVGRGESRGWAHAPTTHTVSFAPPPPVWTTMGSLKTTRDTATAPEQHTCRQNTHSPPTHHLVQRDKKVASLHTIAHFSFAFERMRWTQMVHECMASDAKCSNLPHDLIPTSLYNSNPQIPY